MKLGFLASHNGSGAQAVVGVCMEGRLAATPTVLISNNAGSEALRFANESGLVAIRLNGTTHPDPATLDRAIADALIKHRVELVVLCGYMKKLGPQVLKQFGGRIVNIHPALLPRFGGKGMWGLNVHKAVLQAGEVQTGVTIHLVDADYDTGDIIAQTVVRVEPDDVPKTLQARVKAREGSFLVETLAGIVAGRIALSPA